MSGETAGHCYRLAAQHMMKNPEHGGTLVHGSVLVPGVGRIGHAWVDEGPVIGVWEPEHEGHFGRHDFAQLFAPVERVRYTAEEAGVTMLRCGHWGPWDQPSTAGGSFSGGHT